MFEPSGFSLPVSLFLAGFGLYLIFFITYSLFNLYHLMRYGVYGYGLYLIITVFVGGTVLLVAASTFLLLPYNWKYPITWDGTVNVKSIQQFNDNLFPAL